MSHNRFADLAGPYYARSIGGGESLPPMKSFPTEGQRRFHLPDFRYVIGFLAGAITMLACVIALGQSPASELQAAVMDCRKLPAAIQPNVRYLSLYNAPTGDENALRSRVVNFVVNQLSHTRAITRLDYVSHSLMRLTLSNYAPDDAAYKQWYNAWEALALDDPYWHIKTEVLDGKNRKVVTTIGGWTDLKSAAELQKMTGSTGAILRADYFCARATDAPSYYDFAGIPSKENDFLTSLGVHPDEIEKLRANAGANLAASGVTHKTRRIIWQQGPLGGVYSTLDVERVTADRDPLRRVITDHGLQLNYDLGEWYVMGQNGLWKMALFNSKGERQNSVPDLVAKDDSDPLADGIVRTNQSCVRCHVEDGLRPFQDDQTKLLQKSLLGSYDYRIVQRAQEFYDNARLLRQMNYDRETYRAACEQACGLNPRALADAFRDMLRDYLYTPVSAETAARECGTDIGEFKAALVKSHDPVVLLLIGDNNVLRDQWTSSFAEAALSVEARRAKQ